MARPGHVRRGEIYLADLSEHGGSLRKNRPVLIVQNDVGNRYSPETIVAAIRDAHGGKPLPVFVPVGRGSGGLRKDSIVDAGHLATIPKEALAHRLGALPVEMLAAVDRALLLSLGLR